MSLTKELIEHERQLVQTGLLREVHLHKEGTFLRAYDWSAWLCCRYLHEFKVNKRLFKGVDEPVAYIGFPETSQQKWMPEGAELRVEGEKHLVVILPEIMFNDTPETMQTAYNEWKESIPLTESQPGLRRRGGRSESLLDDESAGEAPATLTAIMQRVIAWPLESKSPLETVAFMADIKQRLASLI